jgi:hypothetical protein
VIVHPGVRHLSIALAVGALGPAAHADVALRHGSKPVPGTPVGSSLAGLLVDPPAAAPGMPRLRQVLISYERLAQEQALPEFGTPGAGDKAVASRVPELLWRAAARLERGDLPAAEPIFEDLFGLIVSQQAAPATAGAGSAPLAGPTPVAIAEGALRCRLARGAQASATVAYMEWVKWASLGPPNVARTWTAPAPEVAAAQPEWIGGTLEAPAVIDEGTGLAPMAPPIFIAEPAILALAQSDQFRRYTSAPITKAPSLGELSAWYLAAMRFEAGLSVERPPAVAGATSSEGLRLVRDVVVARIGDASERDAARAALRGRLERPNADPPPWLEAWVRAAIGRSFISEGDADLKRRGVLELLHVPARFAAQEPYLSGLAIAEAAVTLEDLNDHTSAGVLVKELLKRYPQHPARNWDRLREIGAKP